MLENSVFCVFAAVSLVFSGCTTISWSSPELSKLNETTGPLEGLISDREASWLGSLPMVGGMFGPFLGKYLANAMGRKSAYLNLTFLVICGYSICAFSTILYLFYFARFINGLALGAFFVVTPLYVGEMATNELRGMLSTLTAIAVNSGILLSYSIGPFLSVGSFNILLASISSFFFVGFLLVGKETPYFYLKKNKYEKASQVLYEIRKADKIALEKEIEEQKELILTYDLSSNLTKFLQSKASKKSMLISIGLLTFQQLSGFVAVTSYTQKIFENAGSSLAPELSSIVFGSVQLCACLFTPFVLGHFGRKSLIIWGSVVMSFSEISLGAYLIVKENNDLSSWNFLPIVALGLYIIAYNNGIGTIPTIFLSEIFPDNTKSLATSISITWCYFLGFVISNYFPQLTELLGIGQCFVGFGIMSAISIIFTRFIVLETRGKTLREIQNRLSK